MSAQEVIVQLKSFATDARKTTNERFFKTGPGQYSEYDQFIGVRVPQTRLVAKKYFETITLKEIDQLINHPIHEVRHCGLIILVYKYQSGKKDLAFDYYLKNIHAANNWDLVDTTIPQTIGDYIFNHQDKLSILFNYAKSNNLWEKRIAIVATFAFIKKNQFNPTLEIANTLLRDSHDLIHKAIGWMLREVYKKDAKACKAFLRENYAQLPRTTLRYAIERMTEIERKTYLKGIF
jgi:3-methyladenine DNA glycosylase AlkD